MSDRPGGATRIYFECRRCFRPLSPQREWNAMTPAERREAAAEGFRKQGVGSYCSACSKARVREAARG